MPAPASPIPERQPPREGRLDAELDEWTDPEWTDSQWTGAQWAEPAAASVVRPYTWTGGRTSPVFDLAVETLVSTTDRGREMAELTSAEHRAVTDLCRAPRSVAEVAALLSLPLGVARVLLADMAEIGLVLVHRSAYGSAETADMALMERVLSGLRRL